MLGESGFRLETGPDTVRAPDAAFIARERLPVGGLPERYWPAAPDLAVEVVSPGDTYNEVHEKALDWLAFGARLVWVVAPRRRTVTVYRAPDDIVVLDADATLEGGDVVPGWSARVAELFE
jgi:Uma2 family endonuclease